MLPNKNNSGGFTLLEVALVLILVGLLTGAALSGQHLVTSVQVNRAVAQVREVSTAYLAYLDRYRSLPGDDPQAASRWPAARNGNGDGILSGRFDDPPPGDLAALAVSASGGENFNFWWHLRLAGLINGPPDGAEVASPPVHPFGGSSGIQQEAYGMRGVALCMENVPGTVAASIDRRADDERPGSGAVRAAPAAGGIPPANYPVTDEPYTVCVAVGGSSSGATAMLTPVGGAPAIPSGGDPAPVDPGGSDSGSGGDAGSGGTGGADAGTGGSGGGAGGWDGGGGGGWDGGGGGWGGWGGGGGGHH